MKTQEEKKKINKDVLLESILSLKEKNDEFTEFCEQNFSKMYDTLNVIARRLMYKEKNINILLVISTIAMMFSILCVFL